MSTAHSQEPNPHHIWVEAEELGPLSGANFSFQHLEAQTKGAWSLAGPGVSAEWTQGGESGALSIAAREDEPAGTSIGREVKIPAAGKYFLWLRYADYRNQREHIGVRVVQGGKKFEHVFGSTPVVDELDPLKLYWDWAFGWDKVEVELQKGAARLELYSTGPSPSRRHVDAMCLTTDANYKPTGRDKPDFAAWKTMRNLPPSSPAASAATQPGVLQAQQARPSFQWNVREHWLNQLDKPQAERIEAPFQVEPTLLDGFLAMYRGKQPPVYSHAQSGAVIHLPFYPAAFADGSPFLKWLESNPDKQFSILLNYAEPEWTAGTTDAQKRERYANLLRFKKQFLGFIAGENIAYAKPDMAALQAKVKAATSRTEVLAALREVHTAATIAKFSGYFARPLKAEEAWADVISCQSWGVESHTHALAAWGEKRLGHESTGNSAALSRRLAFVRGAARQFGTGMLDYQSINFGDSATMFSRESFFYPASSRYVLDSNYDIWGGAGVNWLLKDYMLWHLAGTDAFYNEQGTDFFWKPAGGAAGDDFPIQLSPKGKVADAMQKMSAAHPRGAQFTPVAFLLDQAHGWDEEEYQPGAFGLDPNWNPKVLARNRHDAAIRGWLDVAYYPVAETQNEPASAIRQSYINGVFGDIFDVIVTAPGKTQITANYPVVVAAGEINLSSEWGDALLQYVQNGGTLIVGADQLSGAGAGVLGLQFGETKEAASFTWANRKIASNLFRYKTMVAGKDGVLAATLDGAPLCIERAMGKGKIIIVAVSLGIGIDERPTPLLPLVLRRVTQGVLPVTVQGDVEWVLNKLENGGWLVTILNNRGVIKPQHGVLPTDYKEAQTVTIRSAAPVKSSREWMTETDVAWQGASTQITIPAGAVRMIEIK